MRMSMAMSIGCAARQAASKMVAIRMCSRLFIGSASMPASSRMAEHTWAIRSRNSSALSAQPMFSGGFSPCNTLTGMPASLPGV